MSNYYSLAVKKITPQGTEAVEIELEMPDRLKQIFGFEAGQYINVRQKLNGETVIRSYSLCSAPHENSWRIGVKKIEGGLFSTFANQELKQGDTLEVMSPIGSFVLPQSEEERTVVGFAVGSGITPILSHVKSLLTTNELNKFVLFYGNKRTDSIMFLEELEALKNLYTSRISVYHIFSRESVLNPLFKGRIDGEKCRLFQGKLIDFLEVDDILLCGPYQMVDGVKNSLIEIGVDRKDIHFELFQAPEDAANNKVNAEFPEDLTGKSMVHLTIDGVTHEFLVDPIQDNVLDQGLKAGADLPYACKGGVCCTCKAKVVSGSAKMRVNYTLEPEEVESGFVLCCQAYPTSEELKLDFDEKS